MNFKALSEVTRSKTLQRQKVIKQRKDKVVSGAKGQVGEGKRSKTLTYLIFSIKRPWRLFQTSHGGPGVCLNQQFIWARHFLRKSYYSFFFWQPCILPLNSKFIIKQINVLGAYLQFPL